LPGGGRFGPRDSVEGDRGATPPTWRVCVIWEHPAPSRRASGTRFKKERLPEGIVTHQFQKRLGRMWDYYHLRPDGKVRAPRVHYMMGPGRGAVRMAGGTAREVGRWGGLVLAGLAKF